MIMHPTEPPQAASPGRSLASSSSITTTTRPESEAETKTATPSAAGSFYSVMRPLPSEVASDLKKGLYSADWNEHGSDIFDNWTEVGDRSSEGLKTESEEWPAPLTTEKELLTGCVHRQKRAEKKKKGLFSCFGNAYGVEFSFICGSEPGYNDSDPNRPPTKMRSPSEAAAPPQLRRPRYKECLKNHAVGIGGNAVDGCGEFLPAGEEGSLESLRCAACNCHRNFHRKETDPGGASPFSIHYPHPQQQQLLLAHHGFVHAPQPRRAAGPLALPSSSGGGGSREETDEYYSGSGGKSKRFRTKFTPEQKEKMLSLAERLDWKIQKQDEESVQRFCTEVGVKRKVLKVWMHNNKKI